MCAHRPYRDRDALMREAERGEAEFAPDDWREAFAHHPRIGDLGALRERFAATAGWAGDEQRGATAASDATLAFRKANCRPLGFRWTRRMMPGIAKPVD